MTATALISIDLEVGRDSGHIHQLAGVLDDGGACVAFPPGKLPAALQALDNLADRAILVWRKSDSAPEYQARCRCEAW